MIVVTLTRKSLERADACAGGLALFDQIAGMTDSKDRIKVRWTRLHRVWAAATYPYFCRWLLDYGNATRLGLP